MVLKLAGALATALAGKALARMAECEQTKTHLPHWVHKSVSSTGICSARLRFSKRAVPVGQVPSAGKKDTGTASPLPAIKGSVSLRTNSLAVDGTPDFCVFSGFTAATGSGTA